MIMRKKRITIDFSEIPDYESFYKTLKEKLTLPNTFGDNLDALYDVVSGGLAMPLHLQFTNFGFDEQVRFSSLMKVLETVEKETKGFKFSYKRGCCR